METKQCGICKKHFPKTLEYFYKNTWKQKLSNGDLVIYEGLRSSCKICKIKEQRSRVVCPKKQNEYRKKWKINNPEKISEYAKNRRVDLPDYYICDKLKRKVGEVPKEIIEFKRLSILIKRELEKLNK